MTATDVETAAVVDGLPPGPGLPVGVQTLLFGKYRHRYLPAMQRRYGDMFTLRIAPHARRLVLISRPEDIRTVFTGPTSVFHAGEGNAILGPVMGDHSVLLLDESEHMRVRQLLMPAFHGAALRGYRDLVTKLARSEVQGWPAVPAPRSDERADPRDHLAGRVRSHRRAPARRAASTGRPGRHHQPDRDDGLVLPEAAAGVAVAAIRRHPAG